MRLWADLWLQQAMYTAPLRSRHMPLRQRVSWMAGDVQKVAVLFDHPGLVIWVPFYGDTHLKDLKYSYMADGIRTLNPELSMTPHIAESILTHIIWNDFSAVSDDVLGSAVDRVRKPFQSGGKESLTFYCRKSNVDATRCEGLCTNLFSLQTKMICHSRP